MREAGVPSTGVDVMLSGCVRPTGGSHCCTTESFTLLIKIGILLEIPKGPEPESPARGLRRTALGRVPRATSTPPRAAPPRLASYNGTVGGTVGRASRARLSPPRQPTPLLSGTCLTSAGRPPLRGMLATEGPGHPEGYPGSVEARYALS